ncbi:4111_t:CDS:2 [Funneliformis geosporum]|uniref:4111_t:CDS:1 n=1 Tax=Funneliformis geosporum TaxID=1117311 RepID=A0A9W4SN04_9GLOM|nr:4111_t:CDS:2 [Funneliformis geosporum]
MVSSKRERNDLVKINFLALGNTLKFSKDGMKNTRRRGEVKGLRVNPSTYHHSFVSSSLARYMDVSIKHDIKSILIDPKLYRQLLRMQIFHEGTLRWLQVQMQDIRTLISIFEYAKYRLVT